jgi:hypothetical protein
MSIPPVDYLKILIQLTRFSQQNESEPDSPEPTTETLPGSSVPLSRIECEQAGHTWNESSNTCG